MIRKLVLLSLMMTLVSALSVVSSKAQKVEGPPPGASIRAGATGAASSAYVYWVVLGDVFKKGIPGLDYTVVETGATIENTHRLLQGSLEIIMANTMTNQDAYTGRGEWAEQKEKGKGVRNLFPIAFVTNPMFILVGNNIETIYDLDGKRVAPGSLGASSTKCWRQIFEFLGVKPNFYLAGYSDIANVAKEKRVVAFSKGTTSAVIPDSLVIDVMTRVSLKVLTISDKDREKIKAEFPEYSWIKMKADNYQKGAKDVYVPGWTLTVGTHKDAITNEVAYWLTKVAYEGRDKIAEGYPGADIDWREAIKNLNVPLHAGALKYFKEIKWDIPSVLIPPEYNP
jgi:TRAP transporter TAXI family solute receptor